MMINLHHKETITYKISTFQASKEPESTLVKRYGYTHNSFDAK